MANYTCKNMLKVCTLRVLRLEDDGTVADGADAMYIFDSPILFGYTEQRPEREVLSIVDGCGNEAAAYTGPVRAVNTVTLRMDLPDMDAELIELLAGGSLWTDVTYGTIGYKSTTDATVPGGVAVETWSIAWNARERAVLNGNAAWYRHVFPLTRWQLGEVVQQNQFSTIPLTGVGEVNSGFTTGLATDPLPSTIGDSAYGWFIDDAKPTGVCGYQTVA